MPISSNKSSLKVETNIGGTIYENETTRDVFYGRNQQCEPRRKAGSHPKDVKVFGRPAPTEEFEMPPAMEKAIADDLTTKGVQPKPKRTRRTKKTTTTTEQTDDQS